MKDKGNSGAIGGPEDVEDEQKRAEGQTAHHGDLAGPGSADAGRVQAPQKGDPHSDDRQG